MFRSVRYQNPVVREHLASQYALGTLSPLVKRRVEAFMEFDETFRQEVSSWQETLSSLASVTEEVPVPSFVKTELMANIQPSQSEPKAPWYDSLMNSIAVWRGIAFASVAVLLVVSTLWFNQPNTTIPRVAYLALMESEDGIGEPPLVITAYAKLEDSPSRLELRWNDRVAQQPVNDATLWAVARETGEVRAITTLTEGRRSVDLNSEQWQTVKDSLELVLVGGREFDGPVLLRGLCVQLTDWT